ncbi:MAG: HD domain-containing protein, partial [Candidatus Hydrogenedentes bacterium]|nr:HD domain-containing protein [Candidatus Hydrogenedentota bacterium]
MTTPFHDYVSLARASDPAFKDIPRSELLSATRAHAKRLWHDVAQRHRDGESGGNVVRLLSQNADEIVRGVLDFALYHQPRRGPFAPRFALCALGGYGREELNPCSDLDVCLVYQGRLSKSIESLNAYFVPFLWDLGFRAGTAVHRISDASLLAANDPEVFTTFSQARMLAGDSRIFARLQMRMDAVKARGARHVMAYIMRRSNTAHLPDDYRDLFSPEPDIKQNIGGLRDFHAAQWLFLLTHGTVSVDALTTLGVLKPESQLELLDALDFVWRLRNELHFHTGKAQDKLSFALQKHVADAFEYGRTGQVPVDRLMQDYYAAARRLRQFLITAVHLCDRQPASPARASLREGQSPVSVRDGRLYLHQQDPHWFAEHPARLIEVFWQATRRKVLLSPATERLVRQNLHLVNEAFRSNDLVRHFFVAICNRPAQAGAILRQMHECGLLSAYLPEFAAIEDIVRYEDFHHYPVDEHTLRAIEALAQIPAMTGSVAGVLQRTFEQLSSPYLLVLAILFHDLGKAGGEEHVEEGARLSQHLCQRMGLRTDETDRIVFLVRNHLLMTHISMYRDTDDWHTVHRFAETMKSDERLRELLLLSYADLSAVGPN